ncbi:P-loop containing nucleoside triphosphate hydrolase protein [Hanseniaspora valbyensis NRRL Y-1626]|uniref:p-loop containing nucleoside triphosphate hydrolase protein n=1 Tax=Hanseniaspora valbyensis NRRL Y-1626 TaxID=766949 RepID=A0A1B7TAZ7_9ASCO|nr:P-loop containing nucleoside triphosphate hydrolase protein [Hanseniaspora valbyensis NRRL Y-1626]
MPTNSRHDNDSESDFEIIAISNSNSNKIENFSSYEKHKTTSPEHSINNEENSLIENQDLSNENLNRNYESFLFNNMNNNNQMNEQLVSLKGNNPEDVNMEADELIYSDTIERSDNNNIDTINLSDIETQDNEIHLETSPEKQPNDSLKNSNISPNLTKNNFQLGEIEQNLRNNVNQKINTAIQEVMSKKETPAVVSNELMKFLIEAKSKYTVAIEDFQNKKLKLLTTKAVLERKIERKTSNNDNIGAERIKSKLNEVIGQIKNITQIITPVSSLFMFYQNAINSYESRIKQINSERQLKVKPGNFFDKSKEEPLPTRNSISDNKTADFKIRRHISKLYSEEEKPSMGDPTFSSTVIAETKDSYNIPPPVLQPTKQQALELLKTLDLENNGFNIEVLNSKRKMIEKANSDLKKQLTEKEPQNLKNIIEDETDNGNSIDFDMEKIAEPHFLPDSVVENLISVYLNKGGMNVSFSQLKEEYNNNVLANNDLTFLLTSPVTVPRFLVFDDPKKYPFDFNVLEIFLKSLEPSIYSGDINILSKMFLMFKAISGLLIRCRYAFYINFINCDDLQKKYKLREMTLKSSKSFDKINNTFKNLQLKNQYLLLQRGLNSILKYNAVYNAFVNKLHNYEIKLRSMGFPQLPDITTIINFLQIHRKKLLESKISSNNKEAIKSAKSLLKIDDDPTSSSKNITADDLRQLEKLIDEIKIANAQDEIDTPTEMNCVLMKHQKIGLFRLNHLENSSSKGGILGDEMGLGKTIQMIALMLINKQDISAQNNIDYEQSFTKAPTLIIAPVSLLHNWNFEIESKIKREYALSVTIFHESNKPSKFDDLKKFDVVLTSYGTLYSEYRKHLPEAIDKTHNSYVDFFGERRKLPPLPSLSFLSKLKKSTEYVSPFYEEGATFYRIILDEAHEIKNTSTGKSKACCLLSSQYRWCLTGTPVQNNVYDIYALLRFLRIRPYMKEIIFKEKIGKYLDLKKNKSDSTTSIEAKRSAERHLQALVARISLRRTKDTKLDDKPILELPELNDFKVDAQMDEGERMIYSQLEANIAEEARIVLNNPRSPMARKRPIFTLLLRLRQACIHYVLVKIGEIQSEIRDLGDFTYEEKWQIFKKYIRHHQVSIFAEVNKYLKGQEKCGSCKGLKNDYTTDLLESVYNPRCGHCICNDCFEGYCQTNYVVDEATRNVLIKCPLCTTKNPQDEWIPTRLFDLIINKGITDDADLEQKFDHYINQLVEDKKNETLLNMEELPISCKIQQILDIVTKIKKAEPNAKILIFCSFTYFFKILSYFVQNHLNMNFTQFDGTLNVHQKSAAIEEFRSNPDCNLMFISLKAGNVGLTLTMAHHVILVDPYWNPSVEDQAIGRAHRISQDKPVQVHRLLIENTVEDRILTIQQRKKELAGSILDSENMKDIANLGRRELGFLFGLNQLDDNRITNDTIGEANENV